jgi:hypothetical protein
MSSPAAVPISAETVWRLGLDTFDQQMPFPSEFEGNPGPSQHKFDFSSSYPPPQTALPTQSFAQPLLFTPSTPSAAILTSTTRTGSSFSVAQTAAWNLLALRYTDARLRRHQWDWVEKTNSFLPKYTFQPVPRITDIWTE